MNCAPTTLSSFIEHFLDECHSECSEESAGATSDSSPSLRSGLKAHCTQNDRPQDAMKLDKVLHLQCACTRHYLQNLGGDGGLTGFVVGKGQVLCQFLRVVGSVFHRYHLR